MSSPQGGFLRNSALAEDAPPVAKETGFRSSASRLIPSHHPQSHLVEPLSRAPLPSCRPGGICVNLGWA